MSTPSRSDNIWDFSPTLTSSTSMPFSSHLQAAVWDDSLDDDEDQHFNKKHNTLTSPKHCKSTF